MPFGSGAETRFCRRASLADGTGLLGLHLFVDFLAARADRELLRVTARSPLLATESLNRLTADRGLQDLVFLHVVRETFVVAGLDPLAVEEFFELPVEDVCATGVGPGSGICDAHACVNHAAIVRGSACLVADGERHNLGTATVERATADPHSEDEGNNAETDTGRQSQ